MNTAFIIVLLAIGVACAALTPCTRPIARKLWPGPTVKGPGDVYVQAFQSLFVLAGLVLVSLLTSVIALVLSIRTSWTAGMWLSALPIAAIITVFGLIALLKR